MVPLKPSCHTYSLSVPAEVNDESRKYTSISLPCPCSTKTPQHPEHFRRADTYRRMASTDSLVDSGYAFLLLLTCSVFVDTVFLAVSTCIGSRFPAHESRHIVPSPRSTSVSCVTLVSMCPQKLPRSSVQRPPSTASYTTSPQCMHSLQRFSSVASKFYRGTVHLSYITPPTYLKAIASP